MEMRIGQDTGDKVLVRYTEEEAARFTKALTKVLASEPNRRRIDDWKHFIEVTHKHRIEQHFVGILEPPQEDVSLKIVWELAESLQSAGDLLVQVAIVGGSSP